MTPPHFLLLARNSERRRVLEDLLRPSGNVLLPVSAPVDALQALGEPGVDWIILDLSMPTLDLAALRQAIDPEVPNPPESLDTAERRHIALALRYTGGNRRQAARLLGIARSTMLAKLRRYGLEDIGPDS